MDLPSGFRFSPTDHESLSYFLSNRLSGQQLARNSIIETDQIMFYSKHPKDLGPSLEERRTYFFISEDWSFQNQTTREAGDIGIWQISVPKTQIFDTTDHHSVIGSKIGFTFFNKRGGRMKKTYWRMTEYQLPVEKYIHHNEWIVLVKISRGTDVYGSDW